MFKKIGIICLFLIFVCCLSAVSAADLNQTDDVNIEVSCVNGTVDDINVEEVDESQDLDNVSGDLDGVDESEIYSIECSNASSHASAGHKIVSNLLIVNGTNSTPFPVPVFPGDYKPISFVSSSTVGNNTNGTAVCSAGDNAIKGTNMSPIEILKAMLSFDFKKLTGVVPTHVIVWLIMMKVAKDLDARYKKKSSGKYLTYV